MAEDSFLDDDFLRQLMSVGEVDLLVGIPLHSDAEAMDRTVQIIEEAFQQAFVRDRVVIVHAGGGLTDGAADTPRSSDGTSRAPQRPATSLRTIHRVFARRGPSPSPGMALRTIVAAADLLRAKACAMVSPATPSLTPSWVVNLLRPVYREGYDFVAPLYCRPRYQGLLARNLLYPMGRAIFGQGIRELYGDEWGFSGRLAGYCLEQKAWQEQAVRKRPSAWMGVTAMCAGHRCCQSFLGPKVRSRAGAPDLVEALRETVGSLLWCMEVNQACWLHRDAAQPVPTLGADHELLPEDPPANPEKIFELFRGGVDKLDPLLASILAADTHTQIKTMASRDHAEFRFPTGLWVKALYEFAAAYHHAVLHRDHLVQALVPLYRGRLYSFLSQHANSSGEQMEAQSQILCREFEAQKPYLIERWKAKS